MAFNFMSRDHLEVTNNNNIYTNGELGRVELANLPQYD